MFVVKNGKKDQKRSDVQLRPGGRDLHRHTLTSPLRPAGMNGNQVQLQSKAQNGRSLITRCQSGHFWHSQILEIRRSFTLETAVDRAEREKKKDFFFVFNW